MEGSLTQYYLISAFQKTLFLIDLQSLKIIYSLELPEKISSVYKIEEQKIILGGETSIMLVHFESSQKKLLLIKSKIGHSQQINGLGWFSQEKVLVTGSNDGTVGFWKVNEDFSDLSMIGNTALLFNLRNRPIWKVLCLPFSKIVLVCNETDRLGVVKLDFENGNLQELESLTGFDSSISTLSWNGKGGIFASSFSSKELYEIEVEDIEKA